MAPPAGAWRCMRASWAGGGKQNGSVEPQPRHTTTWPLTTRWVLSAWNICASGEIPGDDLEEPGQGTAEFRMWIVGFRISNELSSGQ